MAAASDINVVVLVGRLTRDAELRYTSTGTAVCKFSLAVNRRKRSGDNWENEASFFDVVVWGRQGEAVQKYLEKGKQVSVSGELRQNRWEQNGQNRSRVEIVAFNLELLGGNPSGSGGGSQYPGGGGSGQRNQPADGQNGFPPKAGGQSSQNDFSSSQFDDDFIGPEQFDDDIPF